MPCLLSGQNDMVHAADKTNIDAFGQACSGSDSFVMLCALQLKLAIDDSRQEMDGLTAELIGAGNRPSVELITRLQSVDRLMQRLTNVQTNLEQFASFLRGVERPTEDAEWRIFLGKARETFTMEQERDLFDAMYRKYGEKND